MSRTKKPVVDRKRSPPSSGRASQAAEPRHVPVARPPRRHKWFLLTSLVLLGAWMALLVWLAIHAARVTGG